MTNPNQPAERLPPLLAELLDGQLSGPQLTELQGLLRDDPAARQIYAQHLVTHALLTWEHGQVSAASSPSPRMGETAAYSPSPLMGEGRGEGLSSLPLPAPPTKSPVLSFLGGVIDYVSQSRTLMFWLIGGTLGLYFAVQLGSLLMSRFWAQNAAQVADDRGSGTENRGQFVGHGGAETAAGKVVARLTNAVDCQWKAVEAGRPSPQPSPIRGEGAVELAIGTQLYAGQKLNLTAGLAELTFDSGAKVVLTAPTQFDLTDALGGDLQLGKLAARVPHDSTGRGAIGFSVGTPSGKVVDLGTEFAVKVLADRTTNVVVYVGEVEVNAPGGGAPGSGDSEPHTIVHVKAGQAVTVGPDKTVKPISAENERFVRDLAPLGSKQESQAAYAEFVKRLKPIVWLRMEGKDDDRVLHDDAGATDAKLFWDGPGNPFVKGRIGKGLWLRGDKLKDCAILPDYPKAEHGKLTVAAWVYAESRSNFATIAKNWHHGEGVGQFHFGLISKFNWDDASYHPDGEDLGVEVAQADGTTAAVREGAERAFPLGQWQHVAFVADGENVHLYRQGREVAAAKCVGVKFPVGLKALGIGAKPDEEGAAADIAYPGFWTGKLDEITIFNDALTAEEIKKLAAAAPR